MKEHLNVIASCIFILLLYLTRASPEQNAQGRSREFLSPPQWLQSPCGAGLRWALRQNLWLFDTPNQTNAIWGCAWVGWSLTLRTVLEFVILYCIWHVCSAIPVGVSGGRACATFQSSTSCGTTWRAFLNETVQVVKRKRRLIPLVRLWHPSLVLSSPADVVWDHRFISRGNSGRSVSCGAGAGVWEHWARRSQEFSLIKRELLAF